jgi:hypothetical protein
MGVLAYVKPQRAGRRLGLALNAPHSTLVSSASWTETSRTCSKRSPALGDPLYITTLGEPTGGGENTPKWSPSNAI